MCGLTDIGKVREVNEDYVITKSNAYGDVLLIVADGMGGRNNGDYASRYVCEGFLNAFMSRRRKFSKGKRIASWMYKVLNGLNRHIFIQTKTNKTFGKMGTTFSAVILSGRYMVTAQVGDSRIYIINAEHKLQQLSVDQSYVQYLENAHKIDERAKLSHPERHKITNAIGIRLRANVDLKIFEYSKQTVLVCSDGLYNNVSVSNIESILRGNDNPERKCKQLISFANSNGGSDNISVVVWETTNQ